MDFQDLEFLPSGDSFYTSFLKYCDRGKSLRQPHILKLWFGVSKGMFPVRYFCSNKASFCVTQIS